MWRAPGRGLRLSALELAIVLLSALLHAWWSFSIKASQNPLAFNLVQLFPAVAVGIGLVFWVDLGEVPHPVWLLVAATGVAHALYLFWMSLAYESGDLTLVYPIARSTPAFLPLFSIPLLGESISLFGALGIAMVVAGIWMVQAGQGLRWATLLRPAVFYAYLTLAATVAYSMIDKAAMATLASTAWSSPVPRAVFYYFLLVLAHAACFTPLCFTRIDAKAVARALRFELPRAFVAGAVSFTSYGLILEALRSAQVSYVVAVRQSSVLFVMGLGVLWLRETPGRARLAGAALTVAGVALVSLA